MREPERSSMRWALSVAVDNRRYEAKLKTKRNEQILVKIRSGATLSHKLYFYWFDRRKKCVSQSEAKFRSTNVRWNRTKCAKANDWRSGWNLFKVSKAKFKISEPLGISRGLNYIEYKPKLLIAAVMNKQLYYLSDSAFLEIYETLSILAFIFARLLKSSSFGILRSDGILKYSASALSGIKGFKRS